MWFLPPKSLVIHADVIPMVLLYYLKDKFVVSLGDKVTINRYELHLIVGSMFCGAVHKKIQITVQ